MVALRLGVRLKTVTGIIDELTAVVREQLVDMEIVKLDGLGEMNVSIKSGRRRTPLRAGNFKKGCGKPMAVHIQKKYFVSFRKSAVLKAAIVARHGVAGFAEVTKMEKYGVDESGSEQEKKAQAGCPNCGSKVEKHGNVLVCPKCGTAPFEGEKK
jgi:nucleoid DNA-binding protein/ribosomal protein S27AE